MWLATGARSTARRRQLPAFSAHGEFERLQAVAETASTVEGEFTFSAVAGGNYTLFVEHPEHPAAVLDDLVVGTEPVNGLVVVLEPGAVIAGRVVGVPAGTRGLIVAMVSVDPGDDTTPRGAAPPAAIGERSLPAAADGTFTIKGLRPGGSYRVHAAYQPRSSGYRIASRAVQVVAGTVGLELPWDCGMRVLARIVAAGSDEAVVLGTVQYRFDGGDAGAVTAPSNDSFRSGRLELGGFWPQPGQTMDLTVAAVGFAPWSRTAIVLPASGDLDLKTIALQRAPVAKVVVLAAPDGKPVPKAVVEMKSSTEGAAPAAVNCDGSGSGTFHVTPGSTVVFVAKALGFTTTELGPVTLPASGDSKHEIRLPRSTGTESFAALRGSVFRNGRPLGGARLAIEADQAGRRRPHVITSAADGSFHGDRLPPTAVVVYIDHREFAFPVARPTRLVAGDNTLAIDLAMASVAGQVVDASGGPLALARVSLLHPEVGQRVVAARTDASGRFAFAEVALDAGIEVRVDVPGHASLREPVRAGDPAWRLVVQATGQLQVQAGSVGAAVAVRLQSEVASGRQAATPRSAALVDGQARLDGLVPATWRAELLDRDGAVLATRTIAVASGQTATVAF